MEAVLLSLWEITQGAWVIAGLIVLARVLLKRVLTPKVKYYLWLLLALRLMLPVLPESDISLMNYLPEGDPSEVITVVLETENTEILRPETGAPVEYVAEDTQTTREKVPVTQESEGAPADRTAQIFFIWVLGAAVTCGAYIVLYGITALQLRRCSDCRDEETVIRFRILKSKLGVRGKVRLVVGSGGMFGGLIRPTIVLPAEVYGAGAEPILVHELTHYRYGDGWLYLFMRLMTVLHWYNPVVWICFHFARLDSEASCDQRVLDSGLVTVRDYIRVLSEQGLMEDFRPALMASSFAATEKRYMKRLRAIARYSGKRPWVPAIAILVAGVICAFGLTAARSQELNQPQEVVEINAEGYSSMTEVDGTLYLVDLSGNILTMDWETGETETFFRTMGFVEWCSDQTLSYLYYMDGENLCRVSTQTRQTENLCEIKGPVKILAATENGLFYGQEDGYYALNLTTMESVLMYPQDYSFLTYIPGMDDSLYIDLNYSDAMDRLERWDLATGEKTVLLERDNDIQVVTEGTVTADRVYFYIGRVLHSMPVDGSAEPDQVPNGFDASDTAVHCSDDSLIFSIANATMENGFKAYRYDPATGLTTSLSNLSVVPHYAAISDERYAVMSGFWGEGELVIADLPD